MYTEKDKDGRINIMALTEKQAGLIQSGVLQLVHLKSDPYRNAELRRIAMEIDKQMPNESDTTPAP